MLPLFDKSRFNCDISSIHRQTYKLNKYMNFFLKNYIHNFKFKYQTNSHINKTNFFFFFLLLSIKIPILYKFNRQIYMWTPLHLNLLLILNQFPFTSIYLSSFLYTW